MTCTITSALRVSLVAGTGVVIAGPVIPAVTTDDVFNTNNPTQSLTTLLDGISSAKLVGSASVDATSTGNIPLYAVPNGKVFIPTNVIFALKAIAGSGTTPSINVGISGTFRELIDSQRFTTFDLATAVPFAAGTGYVPADTLTLSGGTHATAATLNVTNTKLVSLLLNAAGTAYAPADTITLSGGTGTNAVLTVSTVKLVSATINAGGTGYGATQTFNVTVAGGTSTQAAVISVTSNGGGVVTTVNSVGTAGSYTALPTLTGNAVTGGTGTGLTLNLVFGINTFAISNAGVYTVNAASFTQGSTNGSGTGATFNTTAFGVNAVTVAIVGSYSVLPSNHIATTGGGGTGCTIDATWAVTASMLSSITTLGRLFSVLDFSTTAESSGADFTYIPSGSSVTLRVDTAATFSTYTFDVFLFGYTTSL